MGDVVAMVLEAGAPCVNTLVENVEEFHFAMDEKKEAAESVFYPLDPMNKGCIPHSDVMHALSDLGVMDGIHSRIAGETISQMFNQVRKTEVFVGAHVRARPDSQPRPTHCPQLVSMSTRPPNVLKERARLRSRLSQTHDGVSDPVIGPSRRNSTLLVCSVVTA